MCYTNKGLVYRAFTKWKKSNIDKYQHYSNQSLKSIQDHAIKLQKHHREYIEIGNTQNDAIKYLDEQNKNILQPVLNLKRVLLRKFINHELCLQRKAFRNWSKNAKEATIDFKRQ